MTSYHTYSDYQLACYLKNGSQEAFTAIYHRFSRQLLAIGYNYAKDMELAEEIVQQVFSVLWERRDQVQIDTLGAYLATAVKFSVFKTLHRKKRQEEMARQHYQPKIIELAEEKIDAKFLEEYINGIVEQLPEKCKLVFVCSRREGMTNAEIAEELGVAEKTVEGHLTKALKKVRKGLEGLGLSVVVIEMLLKDF